MRAGLIDASAQDGLPEESAPSWDGAALEAEPRLLSESGLEARIAGIIQPMIEGLGFQLVRVRISGRDGMTVQVMAERPQTGGISVEDCADISREISPLLDAHDPIAGAYHLEVSSPGIDRPLVRRSDFEAWIGFDAKIEMNRMIDGRRRFRGTLKGVEGEGPATRAVIVMETEEGPQDVALTIGEMADARLLMSDRLIAETLKATKAAQKAGTAEIEDLEPKRRPRKFR